MALLLTVGGITTVLLIALVYWVLAIRPRGHRRILQQARIARARRIASALADYFGTHRPEAFHGDPVARGNEIIKLLTPIPGSGTAFLLGLAKRYVDARRYPEALNCKSAHFKDRAKAIGSVCAVLLKMSGQEHATPPAA